MGYTISENELDRFCWLLVSWRNRFAPPDETADECIEHFENSDNEDIEVTENTRGQEHGYHEASFVVTDEIMEQLYAYGINVMGRANRYVKINREHDMELRLPSKPNYYLAQENGAEMEFMRSPLYDHVEVESLDRADYLPAGA